MSYRYLEHTADVWIEACGKSIGELFEVCARAFFDTMVYIENVEERVTKEIEVTGFDMKNLLYRWLEAMLLELEINGLVFSDFDVTSIKKSGNEIKLTAVVRGEPYSREKHGSKVEVKAVTYHRMRLFKRGGRYCAQFILDI